MAPATAVGPGSPTTGCSRPGAVGVSAPPDPCDDRRRGNYEPLPPAGRLSKKWIPWSGKRRVARPPRSIALGRRPSGFDAVDGPRGGEPSVRGICQRSGGPPCPDRRAPPHLAAVEPRSGVVGPSRRDLARGFRDLVNDEYIGRIVGTAAISFTRGSFQTPLRPDHPGCARILPRFRFQSHTRLSCGSLSGRRQFRPSLCQLNLLCFKSSNS